MNPKMLRRRADKRCGSDVAPPSKHHRESIESSRSHPTPFKPNTEIEASRRSAPLTEIELRSPYNGISTHPNKPEPLNLAGTGTGVDGAEGASASRRQTQVTERETSPRHPHNDRALAPETEPPWTALFQSSSKEARIGDETEAEIVIFTGGWRAPVTARALTRRQSPDPMTDLLSFVLFLFHFKSFIFLKESSNFL
ncbi:hypothetical protein DY000_02027568 [Brassica cretica]|uniref:Uncharacterized protein n=1 Tax=Brassica cretica TaxID=69181 RepID=A0ABQ7E1M7_BRACR|nr:hypothetical protein DY000_02027568 [Brassica cretica]